MEKESLKVFDEPNPFPIHMIRPIPHRSDNFWTNERKRIRRVIEKYFVSEKKSDKTGGLNLNRVHIEKKGKWHVVSGTVDSHRTKIRYLSLVPRGSDGVQWIVDKIEVNGRSTLKG